MPDPAQRYLLPPRDAFWTWKDGGEVIAWADDTTIAFRPEILRVLQRLAPGGLPPLGAVVLLLAATRDNWSTLSLEPGTLAGMLRLLRQGDAHDPLLAEVLAGLDRVFYLEPDLRVPLEAKAALAEMVFEGTQHRTFPSVAGDVVRLLEEGLGEEVVASRGTARHWNYGPAELLRELQILRIGLRAVDPEALALRLRTGLDEPPQPADLDLPMPERVRSLLAELERDEPYRGLARLARRLMAAVALPRSVADFEELPVGGVSDISNRGPLERLLVSELAHDDLTLAVRVALNEALYLRRETPPKAPMRHRAVLLEAGIRSWGVPRVFATAVALALAATVDAHTEIVTYRAKGDRIEPVDLTRREPLVAHLEALEPDLHPGAALGAFREAISEFEGVAEPVLVTTEDVLDDAEFRQAVHASELAPFHVATVGRSGRFRLVEKSPRGSKLVREARLSLEELLPGQRRPAARLVDPRKPRDLPAILSVNPFPLLLSHDFDPYRSWRIKGDAVLALTNDRRLMLWARRDRGAQQVSDRIPSGALWWSSREPLDGRHRAVVGRFGRETMHLLSIDLDEPRCTSTPLEITLPFSAICHHGGVLFALGHDRVQVVEMRSGEAIQMLRLPQGMQWANGRFFRDRSSQGWHALSFDGSTARLERVFHRERGSRDQQVVGLFERDGVEGPIAVTAGGSLLWSATGQRRGVAHGLDVVAHVDEVSADGRRIVLSQYKHASPAICRRCLVDVDTLEAVPCPADGPVVAESFADVVRPLNLRRRFVRVSIGPQNVLTLTTRKGQHLGVVCHKGTGQIRLADERAPAHDAGRTFKPVSLPQGIGYTLKAATWDDGSRVFLDSRGLLHLQSADRSVPETSIVLRDGELSGWCSDGRWWGWAYYIGARDGAERGSVFETAIRAFLERIR